MKIARILAAACLASLFATEAFATSTCNVREYSQLPAVGALGNTAAEPGIDQSAVDFTSGHAESAAFAAATKYIRIICSAQASFLVAPAPVAANTNSWMPAALPEYLGVQPGHKISFVANP
jgi:hypothetical protein